MELYEKDGKVGILVSHGVGAGWSTWNDDQALAYDKRIVEFWLSHKDNETFMETVNIFKAEYDKDYHIIYTAESDAHREANAFFKSIGYAMCPFHMDGFADISLEFVPKGEPLRIDEHDGDEEIQFLHHIAGFITF